MNLCRRRQPADISDIRRSSLERISLIERRKKCIHRMPILFAHLPHLFCQHRIIIRRHTGKCIAARVGLRQCIRIGMLLFCIGGNTKRCKILIQYILQRMVRHRICQTVDKLPFKRCICHQCRALCDPIDPCLQLYCFRHVIGTHHIKHTCPRLYHVRAASARIGDGIVDSRPVTHMFPQKLYADIHQLDRIQCTAALLRRSCSMGGHSGKFILYLDTGVGGSGLDLIHVFRMPGQRCIQLAPHAIPCHKCLRRSAFFSRAAIEYNRTRHFALLQIRAYADRCSHRTCPEQIVPTAMPTAARYQLLTHQAAGLLGKSGKCIILRQDSNQRPPAAIGRGKCCLNPADSLFYLKALSFQHFTVQSRRFFFLQRKLRILPYMVCHVCNDIPFRLNCLNCRLFFRYHFNYPPVYS